MKRLSILGSTGSIGQQTLEVVRAFPEKLKVIGLAAGSNTALLAQQVQEFQPKLISCAGIPKSSPLEELAIHPEVDLVVVATSGKIGLLPTLAALQADKIVALANKETLVMAGDIVIAEARKHEIEIRPIDSEHSAIWQCLQGKKNEQISEVILTGSGGPFRNHSPEELARVNPAEALKHPTWKMGRKVTIDSATLMNKGMEVIEAHWLFGLPFDKIKVVIHPNSIVHSMLRFTDGSIKAQLGAPDMHLPIQYALSYPERWKNPEMPQLDFEGIISLEFEPVDLGNFPCLRLGIEAGILGDTYPAVLCAADEVAVELFLSGKLGFLDIPKLIEKTLERHQRVSKPSLEDILKADSWARETARSWTSK